MEIRLNGATCRTASETVFQLLTEHAIDPAKPGIAVAINDRIVPRPAWRERLLQAGDAIEIVRPHSGG